MIYQARKCIEAGRIQSFFNYKYIIVDEFQDMGHGRAELIKSLRKQSPGCKLFCVGDDWQSIFRFAGSDISLMTNFGEHFGEFRRFNLTKTYRFNNRIANFSEKFIMKNPAQLRKELVTDKTSDSPKVMYHVRDQKCDPTPKILQSISETSSGKSPSILLLYRYGRDLKNILNHYRPKFPSLNLDAMTIHKSKGLEADYVIVGGLSDGKLSDGKYGFPSRIVDDSVLELVLPSKDSHPHAEERRLFYVALTRARDTVHLIAENGNESEFIMEIFSDASTNYHFEISSSAEQANIVLTKLNSLQCPKCGSGFLTKIKDINNWIFQCSKRPICRYSIFACPNCRIGYQLYSGECSQCKTPLRVCPACKNGLLLERTNSQTGELFFRCSNWSKDYTGCNYKENISPCLMT
jgi:DNA helicase IV